MPATDTETCMIFKGIYSIAQVLYIFFAYLTFHTYERTFRCTDRSYKVAELLKRSHKVLKMQHRY